MPDRSTLCPSGYRATFEGATYEAHAVGASTVALWWQQGGGAPPEGFTVHSDGHAIRVVPRSALQRLVRVRTTCKWLGDPVEGPQRYEVTWARDGRIKIAPAGWADKRLFTLGFKEQQGYGDQQKVVSPSEVADVREEVTDLPV